MSNSVKKHFLTLCIVACGIVFAVSACVLVGYFWEDRRAEADFGVLRDISAGHADGSADDFTDVIGKYESLAAMNGDFVGWLRVYGMNIDYPVMQTRNDPEYYLHRNFEKEYSRAGTPFVSAVCDVAEPGDVTVVYGHKMKNGSMFGKLSDLIDPDFYGKHRYIRFDTPVERRSYLIFCVALTTVNTGEASEYRYYDYSNFKDEEDFNRFVAGARERQCFDAGVSVSYGDEILLLSTCEGAGENGRLIVLGKRIPNAEAPKYPQ
ncbi:MAG: class B sortase [Clostridiales Family XIII bacterium]|nr:class B sortase [Clostridiales Family XIII bacterium]